MGIVSLIDLIAITPITVGAFLWSFLPPSGSRSGRDPPLGKREMPARMVSEAPRRAEMSQSENCTLKIHPAGTEGSAYFYCGRGAAPAPAIRRASSLVRPWSLTPRPRSSP